MWVLEKRPGLLKWGEGRGEREESKKEASSPHGGGDYLFVYKHIIGKRVKSSIEITSKLILSH
jgi:hypothetical protein